MLTPLFWYGLWPHRSPSPYYWCLTVFTYTVHGVCLILMVINVIKYDVNADIAKSVCILLTAFMTFFKVHNLVAKKKEIQYLVDQIINDFQFNSAIANNRDVHERRVIRHGIGTIVKVTKIFFTLNFSTLVIMFAVPLFANSPILPFPSWYPCNWKHNLGCFWVVYVYQVITIGE
jgi:7tm Odorant receptor